MSIRNNGIPNAFLGIFQRRAIASGNPLYKRFSYVFHRTETERGKGGENHVEASVPSSLLLPPSIPSSLPSLAAVLPPSVTLAIMSSSYRRNNFIETDAMFLEFEDDLDNMVGGSSSVGDNTVSTLGVRAPRCNNWAHSDDDRPWSGEAYFPIHRSLQLGDRSRLFVLDFNDQAMNRFVEHQMRTTFKEFRADYHRHFKKYRHPKEARANPPNALEQSRANKAARHKQPYNHSSGSKSFLQRQYELTERKGEWVDHVELFRETHVRAEMFVSQATEDAHNQMLELQSQPTSEGSQPLSEDEICDQVLDRRPGYSKGLGWGPKPKACRTTNTSSSSTSYSQSIEKEIELQAKLNEALEWIEVQDRNHQALASQVETMKKMIEELTRAQQEPPHDP
ncbi:CACTA en-spm transposon protein [Cucumis melo var. makuwa]|uniref:CACTA en-spm transposon protein n=1 Tax=Cucumis melo var. makuwa TaxID=1194695 RepID=A0A5D3BPQ2_CUCMM|nr:CACTA en-spm transposon protein [Cucumis melo var. makuwa]